MKRIINSHHAFDGLEQEIEGVEWRCLDFAGLAGSYSCCKLWRTMRRCKPQLHFPNSRVFFFFHSLPQPPPPHSSTPATPTNSCRVSSFSPSCTFSPPALPPLCCYDSSSVLADKTVLEIQAPKGTIPSFIMHTVTSVHPYSFDPAN